MVKKNRCKCSAIFRIAAFLSLLSRAYLQFYFLVGRLRLVLQAVQCGDHVSVFGFPVVVGQLVERLAGDGHDFGRVVQVDFLLGPEAVDDESGDLVHGTFALGDFPKE